MTLIVHTARIGRRVWPDALDVTRKSAPPEGLPFAPSWEILGPALDLRGVAVSLRKAAAAARAQGAVGRVRVALPVKRGPLWLTAEAAPGALLSAAEKGARDTGVCWRPQRDADIPRGADAADAPSGRVSAGAPPDSQRPRPPSTRVPRRPKMTPVMPPR